MGAGGESSFLPHKPPRGTYMISIRLQVLPTGLISMLSYLFGLM